MRSLSNCSTIFTSSSRSLDKKRASYKTVRKITMAAQMNAQTTTGLVFTVLKKNFCHINPEQKVTIKAYIEVDKHSIASFKKTFCLTNANRLSLEIINTEPCQIIYDVAMKIILAVMICIQLN